MYCNVQQYNTHTHLNSACSFTHYDPHPHLTAPERCDVYQFCINSGLHVQYQWYEVSVLQGAFSHCLVNALGLPAQIFTFCEVYPYINHRQPTQHTLGRSIFNQAL